jgi:hypothetical protein
MINDCKNCHSMVYDSAVGWACSLLKPMKLCEDITQEECPIRRKRFERFQLREALDIVNDRKTMLAEREAQKQAAVESAPKKPKKKRVPKKTVEQQVVEAAVQDNKEKVEKMSDKVEQKVEPERPKDAVHHPDHYTWRGGMECRDIATEMCRGSEGVAAADIYNAVKYIYRYPKKGGLEDIDKAIESLHHLKKVEVGK